MPSVPVLPPAAVPAPAIQGRAPAASDRSVSATGNAAAGSDRAQEAADRSVSFEAVLEAQMSVQTSPAAAAAVLAADGSPAASDASSKADEKQPQTAADAAAALLMLPVAVVLPHNPAPAAPAVAESAQTSGKTLPVEPGKIAAPTDHAAPEALPAPTDSSDKTVSLPANFAAAMQTLPAVEAAPKHSASQQAADVSTNLQGSVQTAPIASASERKVEATQPQPQQADALPGVVGDTRWGEGLSQRVVWMAGRDIQAAKFQVEPPQLGPVEVKVSITNDQASVTFTAPHAATRDAIQTSLPRLQEMLLESGLTLGNVSVGSHTAQDQRQAAGGSDFSRNAHSESGSLTGTETGIADRALQLRRALGLVDLYA